MITMKEPSFCFNSCDVEEPHYEMWRTIVGPVDMTPAQLAGKIWQTNAEALVTWEKPLVNVIINSHGYFGDLYIGGMKTPNGDFKRAMDDSDVGVFGILKPLGITTIWLISCEAAKGSYGQLFCQHLATVAGTEVIASDASQKVTTWQGIELFVASRSNIDDFEGTVYSFTPGGGVIKGIDPNANFKRQMSDASSSDKGTQIRYSIFGITPH
jgi:hypothetical protein